MVVNTLQDSLWAAILQAKNGLSGPEVLGVYSKLVIMMISVLMNHSNHLVSSL